MRQITLCAFLAAAMLVISCGSDKGNPDVATDSSPDLTAETAAPDALELQEVAQAEVVLPPPDFLWPGGGHPFDWPEFVKDREWLLELSTWSFGVDQGEPVPEFRYLPDFALGNGYVFSLLGYANPLHTLHSMSGPIYEKGEGFFSDSWLEVTSGPDGVPLPWQRQWVGRVRKTDITHTQAIGPSLALFTVDVAPRNCVGCEAAHRALVRLAIVKNRSANKLNDIWLSVRFARDQIVDGQGVFETREDRTRWTTVIGDFPDTKVTADGLQISLGALESKQEVVVPLAYIVDDSKNLRAETLKALKDVPQDTLLDNTRQWWVDTLAGSTTIVTPDPRVNDYLQFSKVMLLSQTAATGASSAMCEYTGTWLRDNAGPARFLMTCGLHEVVRGMLDYLWLAALAAGNVKNSNYAAFTAADAQEEPDWANMPVQTGRERAESPSYVPLMYSWYWKGSGKLDFLPERLEMMRYALDKQDIQDDLLPFSTDETFRTAMAVAHGMSMFEQFESGYVSANSSFLWVAAAEALALMAETAGIEDVAPEYLTRADEMRQAADKKFLQSEGWYLPYVHEANGAAIAPFEDVNTKPIWSGYLAPGDDAALDNLAKTMDIIGGEDGILVTPLPQLLTGVVNIPIEEGIYTGMSPGYFLQNLAAANHPAGEAAFNRLNDHLQAAGTVAEYQVLDDFSPLHAVYDDLGPIGDYTARFRPWEGGILGDAAYAYLLGMQVNAPEGSLKLAPNLPNGWSWMEAKGIRVGESFTDVSIQKVDGAVTVTASLRSGEQLELGLSLAVDSDAMGSATVDGKPVDAPVTETRWGTYVVSFPEVDLTSEAEIVFTLVQL